METLFVIVLALSLFIMVILAYFAGKAVGKRIMYEAAQAMLEKERKDAVKKSRSVLTGQFSEQIAPYLPDFPVDPSECKFLGAPIDFVCFRGLNEREIEEIVFVEVKSQNARMTGTEKSIREAVENGRVRFEEYRVK